jgi:Ca2+-binding RTX toxin-like protein
MAGILTVTGAGGVTLTAGAGLAAITATGTAGDDTVTGSATAANTMRGGDGNDKLTAGAGDDTVEGEAGDDTIVGGHGAGNDTYDGGAGIDAVTYTSTTLGIVVDLAAGTATGAEIDSDTLTGIENVTGGSGDDRIGGNAAANALAGGLGSDTAVFTGRRSDYTIAAVGGAYQVTDNRAGPNDGVDTVSGFELFEFSDGTVAEADILNPPPAGNVIVGTPGNDLDLDGTAGADQIDGLAGHDIIDAKGGDDLITAGAGGDLVLAGSGSDTVIATVGDGHDIYHGDGGADTLDFSETSAAATVKLGTTLFGFTVDGIGSAKSAQIGTDVLLDFENAIGGSGNDAITGDNTANVLSGGSGNDTISGLGGSDTLAGEAGNDMLTGGFGADTFEFKPGFGNDRIADFDANPFGGQDLMDISAFGIAASDFTAKVTWESALGGTLVTIDGGLDQTILLLNVQASAVTVDDFRLG